MKKLAIVACAVACAGSLIAANDRTTYRDSMGRSTGSSSTDSAGRTTFRDSMGRMTGTASTDSSGKVTYRDAQGRLQATSSR